MIPTAERGGDPRLGRILLWSALGGAGAFALLSLFSDLGGLRGSLASFPLLLLVPIGLLSLANYALRYAKWHWYLSRLGSAPPHRENVPIFLSGFALTVTPGKMGEFVKALFLKKGRGVPYLVTMPVLLMDRIMDFAALFLLACLGLTLGLLSPAVLLLPVLATAAGLALLRSREFMGRTVGLLARFRALAPLHDRLADLAENGRDLLKADILIGGLLLSVAAWACEGVGYHLAASALGASFDPRTGIFIYAVSTVGGALSLVPGGLGVTEGSLAALGLAFGMTAAAAAGTALIVRVMTLWLAVAIGWGVLLLSPRLRGSLSSVSAS